MCGFFGIVSPSKDFLANLKTIEGLEIISHRGPDDSQVWQSDYCFLGHRRLSIIDTAGSKQPMVSLNGDHIIVFNGEIYNYKSIRNYLIHRGISLKTKGDTEAILELISLEGIDTALNKIEGMFAFAVFNTKSKNLTIARDRIGEKFLYFTYSNKYFGFSSEIKSLFKSNILKPQLNETGLFEYFCRSKVSGSSTLFKNIFELQPGTYASIDFNSNGIALEIKPYWDLCENFYLSRGSLAEIEKVNKSLDDSIASRMISDVPVGILASGGLDSSYIIGELASKGFRKLTGFCAGNYREEIDESPFALDQINFVNQKFNASFNLDVTKEDESSLKGLSSFLTIKHDEPIIYLNSLQLYLVCKRAKEKGMKVLISGEGSDEIFCGYHRHISFLKRIQKDSIKTTSDIVLDELYFGGGNNSVPLIKKILDFGNKNIDEARGEAWHWLNKHRNISPEDLILLFDQRHRLETLLHRQDRIGMAASIELRQPFLNYQLFNIANSLPVSLRYDYATDNPKSILKLFGKDKIHPKIIKRQKTGFPSDLQNWFDSETGLIEILDLCNDSGSISRNHLNYKEIIETFNPQNELFKKQKLNFLLQKIYFLEQWKISWKYFV